MRTILVESEEPSGPYGAKSIGEVAINGPAPAIANAVYDAVGVRLFELPMTPERLWRAMQTRKSAGPAEDSGPEGGGRPERRPEEPER
jgi:hypothetical protein